MTARRRRVQKVISHRERKLNETVKGLLSCQQAHGQACEALELERAEAERAVQRLRELASAPSQVDDWVLAQDWRRSRQASVEGAQRRVAEAQSQVERAKQAVLAARSDLKRVELLAQKLEKGERVLEERAENRQQDEIAAQRFERARRERRNQ